MIDAPSEKELINKFNSTEETEQIDIETPEVTYGRTRILFVDLDNTLIRTASRLTFPLGIWDMKINIGMIESIKKYSPHLVVIITNQGGIESGFVKEEHFIKKIEYIAAIISEYCDCKVEYQYCSTMDKDNPRRKPNIGMLEPYLGKEYVSYLYVGDMASYTDKTGAFVPGIDQVTAENAKIPFKDVKEFMNDYSAYATADKVKFDVPRAMADTPGPKKLKFKLNIGL